MARGVHRFLAPLLAIAVIVLVFLPLSPAYDLRDFLRAGHAVLDGLDVYPPPGSRAVYSGSSFVYPFLAALPFAPLAALSWPVSTALFFIAAVLCVLAACSEDDQWRIALVLATSFMISGLQLGALSPLLFAGVVCLWRHRDRPVIVALVLAPVIVSKLFLAPLLAWLWLAQRRRACLYAGAAVSGLLAAGFALGPLGLPSYLQLISRLGEHETRAGFGLIGALVNTGLSPRAAQVAALALACGCLAAAWRRWRLSHDERILYCAAIVAALAMTPILWSHYLVLVAAPLLALQAPRAWFVALAALSWMIAPAHGVHLHDGLTAGAPSISTALAVGAILAVFAYALRADPAVGGR